MPGMASRFPPYRSARIPTGGLITPAINTVSPKTREMSSLLQPNSSVMGFRKAPKENLVPVEPNSIMAAAPTTTHP